MTHNSLCHGTHTSMVNTLHREPTRALRHEDDAAGTPTSTAATATGRRHHCERRAIIGTATLSSAAKVRTAGHASNRCCKRSRGSTEFGSQSIRNIRRLEHDWSTNSPCNVKKRRAIVPFRGSPLTVVSMQDTVDSVRRQPSVFAGLKHRAQPQLSLPIVLKYSTSSIQAT